MLCCLKKRGRAGGQAVRRSEALREAVGYQQAPRERALREPYLAAAARDSTEETEWEEAWEEGRKMTFEEAVSYALKESRVC